MNENKDLWFWLICILCFTVFLAMSYLGLRYVVRRHIMKDEIRKIEHIERRLGTATRT